MSEKRITPAAVRALFDGDLENALIAMTPGGIQAQEAQGQRDLVRSAKLPKRCQYCTRDQFEAMGIVFGDELDDLFIAATLPDGWKLEATDHHMWSNLCDVKGRTRGQIFYKAAFYDRSAFLAITQFITIKTKYDDAFEALVIEVVNADGETLHTSSRLNRDDYDAIDAANNTSVWYADIHYPDWRNPLAYWTQ